jgi:hypothetical protein
MDNLLKSSSRLFTGFEPFQRMGCVCKRNQEAFYSDRFAAIPLERFSPQQEGVMIPVSEMHPIRFVRLTSDQIQGENLDASHGDGLQIFIRL